jgi:hypothetical protein
VPSSLVSWFSTDSGVARVDSATGWVRAVGPGRATVIAVSGELRDSTAIVVRRASARPEPESASMSNAPASSLSVGEPITQSASPQVGSGDNLPGVEVASNSSDSAVAPGENILSEPLPAQGYEPVFEPGYREEEAATPTTVPLFNNAERLRREAWLLKAVEQCYEALRSRDVARVEELYRAASPSDEEKLSRLKRILRTEEWGAVVGERINGEQQLSGESPSMDFVFQLVWKDAFGGRLTSRPVFRAVIARNGNNWDVSSCRIVGSPKL